MKKILLAATVVSAFWLASCGPETTADGYVISENGMQIKTLKAGTPGDTVTPHVGDNVYIWLAYLNSRDSVIYNESGMKKTSVRVPMLKSLYPGDIFDAIKLMHRGDSIVARVSVDSIKKYNGKGFANLIARLDSTEKFLGFSMRLDSIITKDVLAQRKAALDKIIMQENLVYQKAAPIMDSVHKVAEAKQKTLVNKDKPLLAKFLKDNNITVAADDNGVYYQEVKKGTGKKVEPGMVLKMHYMGRFLDGTLFDGTQVKSWMLPATFGYKKQPLYFGFESALGQMNIGSKCLVVMPSEMGSNDGVYRAFEIEIVKEVTGDEREAFINSIPMY